MIIIRRNGRMIVLKGWRAWLAGAAALIAFWLVLAFFVFVIVGLTITVWLLLLLLLPAFLIVGLVGSALGQR